MALYIKEDGPNYNYVCRMVLPPFFSCLSEEFGLGKVFTSGPLFGDLPKNGQGLTVCCFRSTRKYVDDYVELFLLLHGSARTLRNLLLEGDLS
ncbi:hypothetical protein KIN20_008136 [Parelaphostrongylus tenuis]|uniref:Uncharacterized protein n=1 Tax=Parelaphostrongylus tenuis TaxID=148309 RepID=A0AAD5QJL9_PARTN|nr:hypothetical protein KIN20_008136 [Parelaphostrongylus tenuis]